MRWEYKHRRDHGPLLGEELFQAIDRGLEKAKHRPRGNEFPLVGILHAPDGSRYTGEALKAVVLEKGENLAEMVQTVMEEKKRTDGRLGRLSERARELEAQEGRFLGSLDGRTFKRSAKLLVDNMHQIQPLELKKLVKTLIPKAVIFTEEGGNRLELLYNLDTGRGVKTAHSPIKKATDGSTVYRSFLFASSFTRLHVLSRVDLTGT